MENLSIRNRTSKKKQNKPTNSREPFKQQTSNKILLRMEISNKKSKSISQIIHIRTTKNETLFQQMARANNLIPINYIIIQEKAL